MTRTVFGATGEANPTGLESSAVELLRWDGDSLLFNDVFTDPESADVIRVTQIDGLFDDPPLRQTRTPRPDTYGSNAGIPYYDEKTISLTGYVSAGNFPMLRKLQRQIKQNLSFKSVDNADREFWKLRIWTRGPQTIDLVNPNFETNADGWAYSSNDGAATIFARLANGSLGGSGVLQMKKTSLGASKYSSAGFDWTTGAQQLKSVRPGATCIATCRGNVISLATGATSFISLVWWNTASLLTGIPLSTTNGTASTSTGVQSYSVEAIAPATAEWVSIKTTILNAGSSGTAEAYWDQFELLGPKTYEMLKVQPAGIQMPEQQDSGNIKRPFLVTLRVADPRLYTEENSGGTSWLFGSVQVREATVNSFPFSTPSITIGGGLVTAAPTAATGLGTAKYVCAHIPPYINWPAYTADSSAGCMLQSVNNGLDGDFLALVLTENNEIELLTFDNNLIASTLHTFTLPYEARNKHVYLRAYMSSSSVVACQAYTSRPFTIANKASEPNILLDSSYTLTGADLTKFGGAVTNVRRGYVIVNHRPSADPTFAWMSWVDVEVNDITETPLSKIFTIGGDIPSPLRMTIYGPVNDPTVRITQTAGSSVEDYAEDISFLLYTELAAGEYASWDPWDNTWTHSGGDQILTAPGNRYKDLAPGTYSVVMRGDGTDATTTKLSIFTREAVA